MPRIALQEHPMQPLSTVLHCLVVSMPHVHGLALEGCMAMTPQHARIASDALPCYGSAVANHVAIPLLWLALPSVPQAASTQTQSWKDSCGPSLDWQPSPATALHLEPQQHYPST